MLSDKQNRVFEWLNDDLSLPVFAEAYKGAALLIHQRPAGYVSFVAHAGRDLMNSLASTVKGIKSERVQYQQHIDELQKYWRDEWRFSNELYPEGSDQGHLIPNSVCLKISTLIDEHKFGRMRSSEADGLFFSTFLDYEDKDRIPHNFLSEWKNSKAWFHRHTHLRRKPFRQETSEELLTHFNRLDGYLYIAATSQYDRLRELNDILDATNS